MAPDEQVPMCEQLGHALLEALDPPHTSFVLLAWSATPLLGDLGLPFLAEFGQHAQHRLEDLLQDVKHADLVWRLGPQLLEYLGVKRRAIRGDAAHTQPAFIQLLLELAQECADVLLARVVLQDAEGQAVVAAIVHHAEHAEWPVVHLVDGQIAGEISQRLVEVGGRDAVYLFFPRPPRPSSGWWPRGRRHDGHARGARRRLGRPDHPRPRRGQPTPGHGGCNGTWARPGRRDRRRSDSRRSDSNAGSK